MIAALDLVQGVNCSMCAHQLREHFAAESLANAYGCTRTGCDCERTQQEILAGHLRRADPDQVSKLEEALRYTTEVLHSVGRHPNPLRSCGIAICSNNLMLLKETSQ